MARTRTIATIILMMGANLSAGDISPSELLKKTVAAYRALKTYKSEGTIVVDMDNGGRKMKTTTSFSIALKKPNLYLISWTQKMPMANMVSTGAVWSDGTQAYLYTGHMGMLNSYSKMPSDEFALVAATGISGGATHTIPSLFLSELRDFASPFIRIKNPRIMRTEEIGGEDCYVLTGPSAASKKVTYWISKTSYLIRKYERSLERAEGGPATPEALTDEQLEESMKSMGMEVTEENMKNMKEMMESSRAMLKTMKLKGSSTELHAVVSSPELSKDDFKFALPDGAVLKDSLFGGVFEGSKELFDKSRDHGGE